MKRSMYWLFCLFLLSAALPSRASGNPYDADMVVAPDSSGDFTSLQEAIDAVPSYSDLRTVIYIKRGTYDQEKVIVPADKMNVTLIGESREETVISYHIYDCGTDKKCPAEDVALWTGDNIRTSATLTIMGDGFRAENLTIENTAGPVGQAQAITVQADRVEFVNCTLTGYQDTVYLWDAGKRSYFDNCLIVGRTDYIYGGGIAFFNNCEIRSWGGGWITAPSTPADQPYGFVFYECDITFSDNSPRSEDNDDLIGLGRPWHNCPKVAWLYCDMTGMIDPLGWNTIWNMAYAPDSTGLHLYEYGNTGAGADMSNRANWVGIRELTMEEAADYTAQVVLAGEDNWDPTATAPAVTTYEWTGLADTTGWFDEANWNPQDTPRIGEQAVVDGAFLVTADGGSFEADLTIRGGATLEISDSSRVTLLSVGKGSLAAANEVSLAGRIKTKDTTMLAVSGALSLYTEILGVHRIFKEDTGTVVLLNDNRGFNGEWIVRAGTLSAKAEYSLGGGSVQVDSGGTLMVDQSNVMHNTSPLRVISGAMLELNESITLSEFYIDGTIQPPGEYGAGTNPGLISGEGKVVVGRPTRYEFVGGEENGNWDNAAHFVPALLPVAGDSVFCEREIETTATVFTATLFISTGSGKLRLRGDPSKNHRSTGTIHFADGTSIAYNTSGTGMYLHAPIVADGNMILNMESGNAVGSTMTLDGTIAGEDTIFARNNGKGIENWGRVLLLGDNSGFTGVWDLTLESDKFPDLILDTYLEGSGRNAFGNGRIVAGDFNRVILNDKFCAGDSLDLTLMGNGIAELRTLVVVKAFYLNGVKQENGTYSSVTNPEVFEGEGMLVVESGLELPAGPTDLATTSVQYNQVSLAWNIQDDNADGFVIRLDRLNVDTVSADTLTITGVYPGFTYTVGVYAYNILGNSDTVFIDVTIPEKPAGVPSVVRTGISLFPNPAEDILFLKGNLDRVTWELYDILGNRLLTGNAESIDVAGLPPGHYVLKIRSRDLTRRYLRFIKK